MVYIFRYFFVFIFLMLSTQLKSTEMTLQELFFDKSKPYHLKILDALPKDAVLQVGPDNAENTIIEFMDYFCGYCKKIHPESHQKPNHGKDLPPVGKFTKRMAFLGKPGGENYVSDGSGEAGANL